MDFCRLSQNETVSDALNALLKDPMANLIISDISITHFFFLHVVSDNSFTGLVNYFYDVLLFKLIISGIDQFRK